MSEAEPLRSPSHCVTHCDETSLVHIAYRTTHRANLFTGMGADLLNMCGAVPVAEGARKLEKGRRLSVPVPGRDRFSEDLDVAVLYHSDRDTVELGVIVSLQLSPGYIVKNGNGKYRSLGLRTGS